jgi:hypothetical protein
MIAMGFACHNERYSKSKALANAEAIARATSPALMSKNYTNYFLFIDILKAWVIAPPDGWI